MTNIRRYFKEGDIVFLTHVTHNRLPILIDNIDLLREAINSQKIKHDFDLLASVVLPDHFHILIEYSPDDLSNLMRRIKLSFSAKYRKQNNLLRGKIWQNRFYDHVIRNQEDLNKHIDYIHYNAVKHGLVMKPIDWEHSSFGKYYDNGIYDDDWGVKKTINFNGNFGE